MGAKLGGSSSRTRSGRRKRNISSEINVTPLVDVMLVLLVIFMITAPMLAAGVAVDLPKAQAKAINQQDNAPLEISVATDGLIYMGDTKVKLDRLKGILEAIAVDGAERRVYIRADKTLSYGHVMQVMAAVNSSGFSKIALITDPTQVAN